MKYEVWARFKNHPKYFIEMSINYELDMHPNLTDTIFMFEQSWEIMDISYDIDAHLGYLHVSSDDGYVMTDDMPINEIMDRLKLMYDEWHEWCIANDDKTHVIDYLLPPGCDIKEITHSRIANGE